MKRQGLRAILDLHGLPGSQNGFDNSGRAGSIGWGLGDTLNRTFVVLERLAQRILALERYVPYISHNNEAVVTRRPRMSSSA